MAKNLFIWLLIILLLTAVGVVGLELYGQNQFKPSVRFGLSNGQNFDQVNQKLDQINEKLDKLQSVSKSDPSSKVGEIASSLSSSTSSTLNNANNAINNVTNSVTKTDISNTQKDFEACVTAGGKDETDAVASLRSNLCTVGGKNFRPNIFDLNQEVLTYSETIAGTSGSKLTNSRNETFVFGGGDSSLFDIANVKAGDKFKVTAKVINNNGVYTFQSITKSEKVI